MRYLKVLHLDQLALVDDEDYDRVRSFTWRASHHHTGRNIYVQTGMKVDGRMTTVKLHRFIMGAEKGQFVDHINHDALDNRRDNLRICTTQQNNFNTRKADGQTSIYKGVFKRENGRWRACVRINGKLINIGTFDNEEVAAAAYNWKARELFGEFALLNRVPESLESQVIEYVKKMECKPKNRFRGVRCVYRRKDGTQKWLVSFRDANGEMFYAPHQFDDEIEAAKEYNRLVAEMGLSKQLNQV